MILKTFFLAPSSKHLYVNHNFPPQTVLENYFNHFHLKGPEIKDKWFVQGLTVTPGWHWAVSPDRTKKLQASSHSVAWKRSLYFWQQNKGSTTIFHNQWEPAIQKTSFPNWSLRPPASTKARSGIRAPNPLVLEFLFALKCWGNRVGLCWEVVGRGSTLLTLILRSPMRLMHHFKRLNSRPLPC